MIPKSSGAQPGNNNAVKNRPFEAAIRSVIAEAEMSVNGRRKLRNIAKKLLDLAADGDIDAVKVLADRLDGRPMQALDVTTRRVESLHADQARDLAASYLEASKRAALRTVDGNVIELKPAPDPPEPAA